VTKHPLSKQQTATKEATHEVRVIPLRINYAYL
jgi:hypothetical protein